ncbi:MAG: 3-methyl-2-oxobutanoate hydroxymethyltransferase [Fimbriimonadaceae bacterium]
MPDKVTARDIRSWKRPKAPIVFVTAYDAVTGRMAEDAGVDAILVGDSVGNVLLGYSTTLPVSLDDMIRHTRAVRSVVSRALLVADMPFGSYEPSDAEAVSSAVQLMKAGAEAVKLEGRYPDRIIAITRAGIPVMGHVGMTPQSVHQLGGFRVQGKGKKAERVLEDALALDEAGAFAIVLELIPAEVGGLITERVSCPTIGIGAGPQCDGQIQVMHDLLGLSGVTMKHAKKYLDGAALLTDALREYCADVRSGDFPGKENSF